VGAENESLRPRQISSQSCAESTVSGTSSGLTGGQPLEILTQLSATGFHADGVVVKPLSDASLCFNTCVILRADNTSRLIEEYVRMFLRRYSSQRLPPKQVELSPPARVLDWETPIPRSRS
jgi:hypothetical protein